MEIKNLLQSVDTLLFDIQKSIDRRILAEGKALFEQACCNVLFQSPTMFEFSCNGLDKTVSISIVSEEAGDGVSLGFSEATIHIIEPEGGWGKFDYACLLQMQCLLQNATFDSIDHKLYSREGMRQRVLGERMHKAMHADYRIKWADTIYGDHILTNEKGVKYKIFLRDFENETGYSNSKDSGVNKLGTTKHIMFAFNEFKKNASLQQRLKKQCPFVEIYCDPLHDYAVRYFYPQSLPRDIALVLEKYFNKDGVVDDNKLPLLIPMFHEVEKFANIVVRPEVRRKVNDYLEHKALESLKRKYVPDFSAINAELYDYQKEGIEFASCRKYAIIADEMGLGKTIQAIGVAIVKKELFGFRKVLVVCPASLKSQWKKEIEKFSSEKAEIVQGTPNERARQYVESDAYFLMINYETVLRDQAALNKANFDLLILDEAQRVKNYATKTASAIQNISRKHVLIITGTPIENKLIDLFSLLAILDPYFLGPLWEFSYKHCLFDVYKPNKINAYYNLNALKEKLKEILLRREKRTVLEQLPNVQQHDIPVKMTPLQADFHASYASGIGQIINKKFLTQFDLQRLQQLLTGMRMVCNSTYLVDESTNDSPKLEELEYILLEKLNLKKENRKVIIFSEWVKMHKLIGQMLIKNGIGYSELNGSVPVAKRGDLIKFFEENESCKVFLSTEAGGAGLNLQVADILINFELPWNPAKKNQRIGRIDRLGQKSEKLTVFNFITDNSIEQRISLGLLVKQNLFDNVLNENASGDFVDFTEKGRGQFLQQMKDMICVMDADGVSAEEYDSPEPELDAITPEVAEGDEQEGGLTLFEEQEKDFNPQENQENCGDEPSADNAPKETESILAHAQQMEKVLNNGMEFLSGLLQMATGKDVGISNQKIEVNKETGEVTMKFTMPKM